MFSNKYFFLMLAFDGRQRLKEACTRYSYYASTDYKLMTDNKLNILYISIDPSLGGSTASLYNLIDSVREFVNPIVLFREEGVGVDFFREHGIECHVFPYIALYAFPSNNLRDVWQHPWRWHYIKKIRFDYSCLRFVKSILNRRKIDIVHTNTSPNDIGVLLARKLHAKHIWHVREFCDLDFHFEIYKGIPRLRKLINQADARIAISTAIKEHWKMPNENTWVINNAIRRGNEACYVKQKKPYILFSSYFLTEAKGTRTTIMAFAKSGMAKEGYRLKLMGNCTDDYRDSLCETARQHSILDCLDFVPCQTDVKPWFAKATAYIMASEFEALGRVTAEAMFYGCPVIANATGGTLDLVKDGETGYLFNTIEECAQLIRKVCTESQEAMILCAQDFAVNNLSQEVYGPKIMEVYQKIMNNPK